MNPSLSALGLRAGCRDWGQRPKEHFHLDSRTACLLSLSSTCTGARVLIGAQAVGGDLMAPLTSRHKGCTGCWKERDREADTWER